MAPFRKKDSGMGNAALSGGEIRALSSSGARPHQKAEVRTLVLLALGGRGERKGVGELTHGAATSTPPHTGVGPRLLLSYSKALFSSPLPSLARFHLLFLLRLPFPSPTRGRFRNDFPDGLQP